MNIFYLLILLALCLSGAAFFEGIETGIVSLNRIQLQHLVRQGVKRAKILLYFLNHPDHFLVTTLIGANFCVVTVSVLIADAAESLMGDLGSWLSGIFTTALILVLGEYLPKAWFQSNPLRRSLRYCRILWLFSYIFYPLGAILSRIAQIFFPEHAAKHHEHHITREELKKIAADIVRAKGLSTRSGQMIYSVFDLHRKKCREIMTPISQVSLAPATASYEETLKIVRQNKLKHLPIYQDQTSNIIGVIRTIDLLRERRRAGKTAVHYMRTPQFVPINTPIDELLPRIRLSRQPLLLVTDEKSAIVGIVKTDHILKEIIGVN